jgi:large subunit ribosomal protein L10
MASEKILNEKKAIVSEIIDNIKNSESVILFQYQGLTVAEMSELRNKLNEVNSSVRIYKNTLLKRALDELKINMDEFLDGPNAILFGENLLEPIKIISEFAKDHEKLNIRVGIISGDVASLDTIKKYANIPSREGLLTMLAGGMIQYVKDLSISLNLYAEKLEGKED